MQIRCKSNRYVSITAVHVHTELPHVSANSIANTIFTTHCQSKRDMCLFYILSGLKAPVLVYNL